jgi:hypothetical protein
MPLTRSEASGAVTDSDPSSPSSAARQAYGTSRWTPAAILIDLKAKRANKYYT